jgi:hypothetical protein
MRRCTLGLLAALACAGQALAQSPQAPRTFDVRQTELRRVGGNWVILAEGTLLKDFGPSELDAREALRILRALKANQHATIGTPRPVMEYWLSDGRAPTAVDPKLRLVALDLNTLKVEQLEGDWRLRDARRLLFNFGKNREDAYLALDVIRHYGFTQLGHVGQGAPALLYFLGTPGDDHRPPPLPAPVAAPRPAQLGSPQGAVQVSASAPSPVSTEEHYRFDPRRVEVKREQNEWRLVHAGRVLASFGPNQTEAQFAYNVLQYYRFTEQCVIGKPACFAYFLVNGQVPRGVKFGVQSEVFRPEALLLRQVGDSWVLCEGDRPLLNFGQRVQEARQVLQFMQRHRCDHLCRLGSAEGYGMTFLLSGR